MATDDSLATQDIDTRLHLHVEQLSHKLHCATSAITGTLARSQQRALFVVGLHGELTQQRLLDELELAPASLSELLAKLEEKGYVERSRLEQDRRIVNVSLTQKGIEKMREIHEARRAATHKVLSALDETEKEKLCHLLEKADA